MWPYIIKKSFIFVVVFHLSANLLTMLVVHSPVKRSQPKKDKYLQSCKPFCSLACKLWSMIDKFIEINVQFNSDIVDLFSLQLYFKKNLSTSSNTETRQYYMGPETRNFKKNIKYPKINALTFFRKKKQEQKLWHTTNQIFLKINSNMWKLTKTITGSH